jgi:transposase-like protein
VDLAVPRDREGSFTPRLVPKGARRTGGLDEMIVSLYAGGMTVRDIAHHLESTLGTELSHETISKITDDVLDEVLEWQKRPLDPRRFLVNVANPRERDLHAQIRVEQDAAGGETPLLRTDPSGALGL